MKTWMWGILALCGCAFLVIVSIVVYRVGDSTDRSVEQGPQLASFFKEAVQKTLVKFLEDSAANQKALVESFDRVSRASAEAMDRLSIAGAEAIERAVARLDRLADILEAAARSTAAGADKMLQESAATIRAVRTDLVSAGVAALNGATDTLAATRGVADQARAELASTGAEARQAIAGVRPMLDATTGLITTGDGIAQQGQRGATSLANVIEHYEQIITHPTKGQTVRGWIKLIFASLPAIGNILGML